MKILYDYSAFTYQRYGGVSRCFCELISRLPTECEYSIAIKQSNNIHLLDSLLVPGLSKAEIDISSFLGKSNFKGKYNLYHWLSNNISFFHSADRINKRYSIEELQKGDFDIFHPTGFGTYFFPYLHGKPFVYTIHDMTFELFMSSKGMRKQTDNIHLLAKKASHIITVSQNTKNDVLRLTGISPDKITVIYHGSPTIKEVKSTRIIKDQYFLYVGTRNSYKNFDDVLKTMHIIHARDKGIKLVCTGPSFNIKEQKKITNLGLGDTVIHYYSLEHELDNLYAYALAFIYPSTYEGFGMPILEAYSCGCPVILNHKSCFPEIAGDAAIYFSSDQNGSNMLSAFDTLLKLDTVERSELINRGYQRLAYFSWNKAVEQLVNVYKNVLNK